MKAHVLTGAKHEIAQTVANFDGDIREVIIFVDEPAEAPEMVEEDIFAEMEPFVADAEGVDYSRESLYTR